MIGTTKIPEGQLALPTVVLNTTFRTTPSTAITAGTNLSWAGNTLNATGGSPTSLSTGTVTGTTYGITSDGAVNDIILQQADTSDAGLLSNIKYAEIVLNSSFRTTPSTRITAGTNLSWSGNTLNASASGVSGTINTIPYYNTTTSLASTPLTYNSGTSTFNMPSGSWEFICEVTIGADSGDDLTINSNIKIPLAAGDGKVFTSNAVGSGTWQPGITVGTTAPSSPAVGQLWVDTN